MNEFQLLNTALFRGLSENDLQCALKDLKARKRSYEKDEPILHANQTTDRMGLVLSGSVRIESTDMWGIRTILTHIGPGQYFAEAYALLGNEPMLVEAIANEASDILFLDLGHLKDGLHENQPWITQFLYNLTLLGAQKNLGLSRRSFFTSPKTIRARVLAYLHFMAVKKGQPVSEIPFDRQQFADYLNVDRSALSKELGKMKKDGLISFEKNRFELLKSENDFSY